MNVTIEVISDLLPLYLSNGATAHRCRLWRCYGATLESFMTTMSENKEPLDWYRVADIGELPNGRVKTVVAGTHSMA